VQILFFATFTLTTFLSLLTGPGGGGGADVKVNMSESGGGGEHLFKSIRLDRLGRGHLLRLIKNVTSLIHLI
jgi:hypothetical protein